MERISLHPPVHVQNFIEFDCREKRDRVTTQLTITNSKEINVAFKLKTTSQAIFMVKPGTGIISPSSSVTITIVLVYDPAKAKDIERQRFQLTLLEMYDNVEPTQLNDFFKEKESSGFTCKFKVQLLQQDGQPYLPAQNQFPSQMGPEFPAPPGDGNSRRESGGVPPIQMESRPSRIYQSVIDQELSSVNQIEQNMASNMMNLNKQVDQRLEDVLSLKEKEINKLQEEKKRLEASLNEIRMQATTNKVVEKTSTAVKTFETWQLVGVVIVALFLGYFLGS